MTRKRQRMLTIAAIGTTLLTAALLTMFALRDQIVFFHTPTEIIAEGLASPGQRIRLGGLVLSDSVERRGTEAFFVVTDGENEIPVRYNGILPDLFGEGEGVVAEGRIEENGTLNADSVLARHDERYVPRELVDALKEQGMWRGEGQGQGNQP